MSSRLAIRSAYSLLWGTTVPEAIIAHLLKHRCTAVAITDKNNLYGLHEGRSAAKQYGIMYITAVELTTDDGSLFVFVS